MRKFLAVIAVVAAAAAPCAGADLPAARASVDRTSIFIGDRITYSVEIRSGRDFECRMPAFKERLIGDFEIKDSGTSVKKGLFGARTFRAWYSVTVYSTGKKSIPEVEVKYRAKGAAEWAVIKTRPVEIMVESLLPKSGGTDIKAIKGPLGVREPNWPVIIATTVFFALAGVFAYIYNRSLRRKPVRLPHETALEELEAIRAAFLQGGEVKEYFTGVSDCVRRYIERVFEVRAPEMTTEEFLNSPKVSEKLSLERKELLKGFLSACDLVKFAKYIPAGPETENVYNTAKNFVEETKAAYSVNGQLPGGRA